MPDTQVHPESATPVRRGARAVPVPASGMAAAWSAAAVTVPHAVGLGLLAFAPLAADHSLAALALCWIALAFCSLIWAMTSTRRAISLLAVGGAIATAPDMHRYLVDGNRWLSETQFTSSIAIAQAAPGPNVLFIALLGWNVGLNAGGGTGPAAWGLGALGVAVCMVGILLPSSLLTW